MRVVADADNRSIVQASPFLNGVGMEAGNIVQK